jgi:thiamine transport system ATP-binding protein
LVDDLRTLLRTADVPALVVTHDHDEAMALADRIVLLRDGRVVQCDTPAELWRAPRDEWIARFLGLGPVLDATITGHVATTQWGTLPVESVVEPGPARVVLRPEALSIEPVGALAGVVADIAFRGARLTARVMLDAGPSLDVPVTSDSPPAVGTRVAVAVAPGSALVYPGGGGGTGGSGA